MSDLPANPVFDNLASRWTRLGAVIIDGVLAITTSLLSVGLLGGWSALMRGELAPGLALKLALIGWIMFFVLNGYLLQRYGQTVGKKVQKISIVTLDGRVPQFWPLIIKRYLIVTLITYIPSIGNLMGLVDSAFILRKDKRCLHDLIAGTVVVNTEKLKVALDSSNNQ